MPKVSVLMPVYNTKEEYLRESVESILNQTFKDFELIIVDDGSSSDIKGILDSYNDSRIKFHRYDENFGVAKTRNMLLNFAEGEYAAFQDSDDISVPERLEKQVRFLEENSNISIVGSALERFPAKKTIVNPAYPKLIDFLGGCVFSQGTSMLRIADFRNNNLFYDETLETSEDYELWSRAISILKFANIQEVLLKYRRVGTSLCHSKSSAAGEIDKKIKQRLLENLTQDKKLQQEILKTALKYYAKKESFFEKMFSIKNQWHGDKKIKILTIFGIKLRVK